MLGAMSVADRAKQFQVEAGEVPERPAKSAVRTSDASPKCSPLLLPTCEKDESAAVIKHARRISVSTPIHRRARSDVSILDPYFTPNAPITHNHITTGAAPSTTPTIRTSSFAELDELTAKLEANRPRSHTLAHRPTALMKSIAEENLQLRLCSSTETIRGLRPAVGVQCGHDRFQVSPCLSEEGSLDWHRFVSADYSVTAQPISIRDLAFPMSRGGYESRLCKADSPTLHDEATWLEEELARCSDDDDEDVQGSFGTVRASMEEEYLTPDGSPLLSPVTAMAPSVEIMGLGIQDVCLVLPGEGKEAEKSADSLLEQVAMHEACIQTLRTLSHDERAQATASHGQLGLGLPSMPFRRSSLVVPGLRGAASTGDFSATQGDTSALFDETYDASMSPLAELGHGDSTDSQGVRRASAASYLSTDSTASADLSIASHGSSLLYNAHLAAPGMERGGSADTAISTRPSSIASSFGHDRVPVKPPRSPLRMNAMPLPPLPQPQHHGEGELKQRMNAMPLPPLPRLSKESTRVRRRKEGTELPQLPARMDSLDALVAAQGQVKQDGERLLGDWMTTSGGAEPVPLHKRIQHSDGTVYLPGLGEIVPPSPDVAANGALSPQDIPVYPARKRAAPQPTPSPLAAVGPTTASGAGLSKSLTLKSKLSGRLGGSSKDEPSAVGVLGRMRRSSGHTDRARLSTVAPAAEFPAAWKDRIVSKRPSLDMRRPSLSSLTQRDDTRSRTTGFRKMLSSITGTDQPLSNPTSAPAALDTGLPSVTTLEALAASTFESPRRKASGRRARRYESFIELSDDDNDAGSTNSTDSAQAKVVKGSGRKDLTKMFGASEVDLSQPMEWTASVGRSGNKKRAGLW